MCRKRVCVVTGSRAEYDLLSRLMQRVQNSAELDLQVIASAMHLSPEFGLTYKNIEKDGFIIDEKIDMLLSGDTPASITKSLGLGTIGFADAFQRLKPNVVVLLGDRFEALSAAQSAMIAKIPIAHIHGGEVTEGAVDESIRHAITKMSQLHFVAAEQFRQRVIQLGEQPKNVYVSGAPGIDNIKNIKLLSRAEFERSIGFDLANQNFLVTYHPVTLSKSPISNNMESLFLALDQFPKAKVIFTFPNADANGRMLIEQVRAYAEKRAERVFVTESLGRLRYLSAVKYVDVIIGNSSSGLLEVPSFKKPSVNIGDRQKGRMKASSVIDCGESAESILQAIRIALSNEFISKISNVINPYGDGNAVETIVDVIEKTDLTQLLRKPFFDISFQL